jgi:gluconate 2-dehydrogenase gamma chain
MDDPYAVDRRAFLKTGAAAAAVTAVGCSAPAGRWRVLGEDEALTLAALCDRIVPPDADPGAVRAGVVSFVDRQLATHLRDRRDDYRRGLGALDATALRRRGRRFRELEAGEQDAILKDLEAGRVEASDWRGLSPSAFFAMVVDHTLMGFYGDPRHGGNRDRASWRMLGLPDPPIRGRLHEARPAEPSKG